MLVANVNGGDELSEWDFWDFVVVLDRDLVFVPDDDRVLSSVLLLVPVGALEWEGDSVKERVSLLLRVEEVVSLPLCVLVMVCVRL